MSAGPRLLCGERTERRQRPSGHECVCWMDLTWGAPQAGPYCPRSDPPHPKVPSPVWPLCGCRQVRRADSLVRGEKRTCFSGREQGSLSLGTRGRGVGWDCRPCWRKGRGVKGCGLGGLSSASDRQHVCQEEKAGVALPGESPSLGPRPPPVCAHHPPLRPPPPRVTGSHPRVTRCPRLISASPTYSGQGTDRCCGRKPQGEWVGPDGRETKIVVASLGSWDRWWVC